MYNLISYLVSYLFPKALSKRLGQDAIPEEEEVKVYRDGPKMVPRLRECCR